ncbi:diuretic hormone receptor [Trichonephila clavipes]|nr:diuretic hormone receptor [Trichonephila clavipes]
MSHRYYVRLQTSVSSLGSSPDNTTLTIQQWSATFLSLRTGQRLIILQQPAEGIPAIVAAAWAIVKGTAGGDSEEPLNQRGCPWQNKDYYDYVFSCPVMLVLLINIFFLAKIMWVLITKLRASNTVESKQYRAFVSGIKDCSKRSYRLKSSGFIGKGIGHLVPLYVNMGRDSLKGTLFAQCTNGE